MGIFSKLFSRKKNKEQELDNESDVYFKAGEAYFKKNDYINSKKFFEKALEIFPDHKNALRNLEVVNNRLKIINSNKEKNQQHNSNRGFEERTSMKKSENNSFSKSENSNVDNAKSKNNDSYDADYFYSFFNIPKDYQDEEIKELLSKEFKNWRTKINSPNPSKKYEAEEMLNKIAKARKILLK